MMAATLEPRLLDRLPTVRGRYSEHVPLSNVTWFRVGGPAEVVYRPADRDDLQHFLAERPRDVPVRVIGVGSNILVRDGGVDGVVLRLGRGFAGIEVDGYSVRAGASALDVNVALTCRDAGITGMEFLRGVPGTIGGALRMNAGAYGREMRDVVESAEALDMDGTLHVMTPQELGFAYRRCAVPDDWIFTSANLRGSKGDPREIASRMADISEARETSQPIRTRTGGSTFKNPPGASAWKLIDKAGCRGLRIGGAMVSEQHCNFLVNTGSATAADIEALGEEVRRRVATDSGVELEWEIKRIGNLAAPGEPR